MIGLFAIYDAAAKRYIEPFCADTHEVAIRGFRQACEKEGHQFNRFPEDYSLSHVGSFDPELGVLEPAPATKIAMASSFQQLGLALEEQA